VSIGTVKLFVLFVVGGFALGFGLPALVFDRILRKYRTRFNWLVAQVNGRDDATDR
jgi:hypothetical protein